MSVHLRNITKHLLNLKRIGLFLEGHATVEVSDEDAAKVAGHPLLEATPATKAPAKAKAATKAPAKAKAATKAPAKAKAATKAPAKAATTAPVAVSSPVAEPAGFMGGTSPIQKDGEQK